MKKTILFLFVSVLALSFNACSSDDKDDVKPNEYQQVLTRIKSVDGETFPQPGIYVYIFMGDDYTQSKYKYSGGGAMYEGDKLIKPTYSAITDKDGKSALKGDYGNTPYTIVVQRYRDSTSGTQMFYIKKFDVKNVIDIVY